jgi:hypothetical protein
MSTKLQLEKSQPVQKEPVQPVKFHKDQGSCQLEDEKIQSQIAPHESQSLACQYVGVSSQLVTDLPVKLVTEQVEVGFEEHTQREKLMVMKHMTQLVSFRMEINIEESTVPKKLTNKKSQPTTRIEKNKLVSH